MQTGVQRAERTLEERMTGQQEVQDGSQLMQQTVGRERSDVPLLEIAQVDPAGRATDSDQGGGDPGAEHVGGRAVDVENMGVRIERPASGGDLVRGDRDGSHRRDHRRASWGAGREESGRVPDDGRRRRQFGGPAKARDLEQPTRCQRTVPRQSRHPVCPAVGQR